MSTQELLKGLGSSENPYLICNEDDLFALAGIVNDQPDGYKEFIGKHFLLTSDIKLKKEWKPIGYKHGGYTTATQRYAGGFCGIFNGGGHVISALRVNAENMVFTGLFGLVQGTIRNLGVEGKIVISGGESLSGGIAGLMHQGLLENCYTNITIKGENMKAYPMAGGLLGRSQNTPIKNCYTSGDISIKGGVPVVGYIAGDDQPGTLAYWSRDMKLESRDSDNKELAIRVSGTGIAYKTMIDPEAKVEGKNQTFLELLNSQVSGEMIRWVQKKGQYPELERKSGVIDVDVANLNEYLQITSDGVYRLTGSTAKYGINVHPNLCVTLILNDVNIQIPFDLACPINIGEGSEATLEIRNKNILRGGKEMAGVLVRARATLRIHGGGVLESHGGEGASGIGCGYATEGGNIHIESGTITAKASQMGTWRCHAAGIGGGGEYQAASIIGNIHISGGTVSAEGDPGFWGIGPGRNGKCGKIVIAQGAVTKDTTVYKG